MIKRCNRCVMSNQGDDTITFDEQGNCNYCNRTLEQMSRIYFPNKTGEEKLNRLILELKEKNKDKAYDCLMGISGGLDSCYLAYLGAVKWNLRILAIHIDDGFDTEIAKANIEKLCKQSNIDLNIIYPDKEQFYSLSKAYLKAGVPNLAVPQDNVLFSCIYDYAKRNNISDFLSGGNFALECILQKGNTIDAYDLVNIKDINNKFGSDKIDKLPLMSKVKMIRDQLDLNVIDHKPLNYIDYRREEALKELNEFCGFEYYGAKHLENYFTGFLQLFWLPKKFGVDKRTSHLSSMIISNQMTREEALEKLKEPLFTEDWINNVIEIIKKELAISNEEFDEIMNAPTHNHEEYKTDNGIYLRFLLMYRKVKRMVKRRVLKYCNK